MSRAFEGPDPIDAYLSARLVALRQSAGLSRARVADLLGVSVQQLHKYEAANNRIPAARLPRLAAIFAAPIESFFPVGAEAKGTPSSDPQALAALAANREGRAITSDFGRIRDRQARRALAALIGALARPA